MNVVEKTSQTNKPPALAPPLRLDIGTIITIRMRGHTHSPGGLEYFAPAVVLAQYDDDFGSIDAVVWDSTAGTHSAMGYHTRELTAQGNGGERRMVESQSNIGQVLFAPSHLDELERRLTDIERQYRSLHNAPPVVMSQGAKAMPSHGPVPAMLPEATAAEQPERK